MTFSDELREGLVQTIAQLQLLGRKWYEPPRGGALHLSTLIQQLLSLIAQYGGITAKHAWSMLFESGVFEGLSQSEICGPAALSRRKGGPHAGLFRPPPPRTTWRTDRQPLHILRSLHDRRRIFASSSKGARSVRSP